MRTRTRTYLIGAAVAIFVLLSVLFGPFPTLGQQTSSFYHLSTFSATVQEDTWDLISGKPDLSIIILLSIEPENVRDGYRDNLFLLPTFPETFAADWILPYPVRIPGQLMPFVENPEFILAPGDQARIYLMNMVQQGEDEEGGGVIADWTLSQEDFTLPLTLTAPNGATLTITGIQEIFNPKPIQLYPLCPNCQTPMHPVIDQYYNCPQCNEEHISYAGNGLERYHSTAQMNWDQENVNKEIKEQR